MVIHQARALWVIWPGLFYVPVLFPAAPTPCLAEILSRQVNDMKYKYSADTNEFYPYLLKDRYDKSGQWPATGIDVDESVFLQFINPPDGQMRVAGADGMPSWSDTPLS